jgi:signal transduction histidine kinase
VRVAAERVRLEELVGRALLSLGSLDRVELDVPEDLPGVQADVGLAERVLANLLENAFRHGGGGPVTVRGSVTADGVACEVVDHGPGVPGAVREGLFAPFVRLDGHGPGASGDRATVGLGLGLSVARGFAEAMGGSLVPLETPGGGLTMRFTLPVAGPGAGAAPEAGARAGPGAGP